MRAETLKALKKSIKHHEENRDDPDNAETTGGYCALCVLFTIKNGSCVGCPVMDHTGIGGCGDTPWPETDRTHEVYLDAKNSFSGANIDEAKTAFQEAEQKEIDFLVSLLPEGEVK